MKRVILSVLMRVAAGVTMVTAHDYHGWSDFVANGNILSRTAIGTYTYDVSGKPHAVLSVTNPQGLVSQETLETSFGDLGKIEQIEQGDYETTIDYGPDGERWRSVLQDDGSVTRTVLYAGDYEMVTACSVTRHFYYLGNGIIVMKEGSTVTPLVAVADHLGSITHLLTADGTSIFKASYDAWGRQTVSTNTIGFHRGYCGHEMLPEYGLINMRSAFGRLPPTGRKNGRLYDPLLGRFLSPDNYVQQPDNSQNFNRYTYCLNNPLKYNDPSGEFLHIIFGAVVGGFANLAANWDNIDGFWQGFTAFTVGAGSGAAVAATGGAGAGFWSVLGASATSGAVTSATNNIIAQTGRSFSGFGNVNWSEVAKSSIVGAASCAASGAAGYYVQKLSVSFQGFQIKSPILKSALVSPLASGAGHIAGGTVYGLADGLDLKDAFSSSFDGIWNSMAVGGAIGVASTAGVCYANKINPWTGEIIPAKLEHLFSTSVDEHFDRHAFSHNRHDDIGVDNYTIKSNVKSIISDCRTSLYEGDNTIRINVNGIPKIIRVNIFQGQIRSYNFMPCDGVTIRSSRPIIYLPNQNWKP